MPPMVDKDPQQNNSHIQAVLFDWSGTISDDRLPVYQANKKMCDYWRVPCESFEEWTRAASMTVIDAFRKKGVEASGDEIYALYRTSFQESLEAGIRPAIFPDAHETLLQLQNKGLPLGIVSSHPQVYLVQEARDYLIQPLVEILHGDARNKIDALKEVCQILGLERSTTMYVGDTIFDIRSAREAGLVTAGVSTGYHTHESLASEHPDYLFTSLSQVGDVVGL
ncbi:MAG: Phosphoglycolate phosphatase [Candidatus Uhrbacteria bacterium GW2011_GWA2_52_8d]|uniref:Phosphoglycolate phosphatase n=1 Tax=Candidatus Uhrbacteria bacterium GW2011_GWA2_52_8d TaxID=1618979 RepID=A0A0G1XP33_9BACT|nr:MAG: Phosphoglycolate phosphatase [Candidatus Uhrbacteria bacterium GW2011_GWA2_52_8d]